MAINAQILKSLIQSELSQVSDQRILARIRELLVEPEIVLRNWDYGKPGQKYPCWTVLKDDTSETGTCYCEFGFGPRCRWGLVWLDDEHMSMDCDWFPSFLDAFFDSFASTDLPIWRVFKKDSSGVRQAITDESSWDETWKRVYEVRESDPNSRYDCDHNIVLNGNRQGK